ncbi:MAG: MerR family transcriptional regulator [Chromatiales bacterium]|jgi:DNA-binding transcriptional MerR regulator/methylmalonyl-CoA mutase cobalamin-binding subunit
MNNHHSISDVSRIAGIPKDLLRMWERRYGYPKPQRDVNGDRIYSDSQLDKLILIRQLVDQGKRPGKLMGLDLSELKALQQVPKVALDFDPLLALLQASDATQLRNWLQEQLQTLGLRAFIHKLMVPAIQLVGENWSSGNLAIHQEHLFTETMKGMVRQALAEHYRQPGVPKVMLTTVPGEQHSLGLLMVEALLRLGGADAICFGTEMPFRDIKEAALSHKVDVIGLSFSGSFKQDDAVVMLSGLRQMIDPVTRIWVGGKAFASDVQLPDGVELIDGLHGVERALGEWRR